MRGSDITTIRPDDATTLRSIAPRSPTIRPAVHRTLIALLTAGLLLVPAIPARAADPLPNPPSSWPSDKVELGLADAPGGAASLAASAPFGFRYQYLAGGVNTGNGWSTWNTDGQFVSWYVQDSADHGSTPVFPYYMLLQSNPATGSTEQAKDLNNLKNTSTMHAFYADLRLFFQRAGGDTTVILHVEPDLWGYIEQATGTHDDATEVPAAVASSGDSELAGLPNDASGFARAIVRLRDHYAPNVLLAYHLSVWGTNWDIAYSNSSDSQVDALAARAGAFYQSLGAHFDLTFTDIADRDAAFKEAQYGDGGASWWDDADFVRYARFIHGYVAATGHRVVVWQIPLGNTKMRAQDDTWGHYQDNRVEWFLDDPSGTHLALWRDAGVIALLFGGGAGGTTCACDADHDGTTDPPAINGNTRASLSADDDGGFFHERAAAYYTAGGLDLGPGVDPPPYVPPPTATPLSWSQTATMHPKTVQRSHSVRATALVTASKTTKVRIEIRMYDPKGTRISRSIWDNRTFTAGVTRTFAPKVKISASRRLGTYTVKLRIYTPGGKKLLLIRNLGTFRVKR